MIRLREICRRCFPFRKKRKTNKPSFNAAEIVKHGWRQGSILVGDIATRASSLAPDRTSVDDSCWLVVVSHDCDIASPNASNEPVVEVLCARPKRVDQLNGQFVATRNPRRIEFEVTDNGKPVFLAASVHERWHVPRGLLCEGPPSLRRTLAKGERRVLAEWLAKRYIRAAFPDEFDRRWRGEKSKNLKKWTKLLKKHNKWIQGVYLKLSTTEEIGVASKPYRCDLIVAIPEQMKEEEKWPEVRSRIEDDVHDFWSGFEPGIVCDAVHVLGTDEVTLAEMELYQRFDSDWLSYLDDEAPITPHAADMRTS